MAAGDGPTLDDFDGVICDRVASPPDRSYLEYVQHWLDEATPGPGRAWVTVSAFGLSGPAKDFKGSEHVCAAAGGLVAMSDSRQDSEVAAAPLIRNGRRAA